MTNKDISAPFISPTAKMTADEFADLGTGHIAYLKAIRSEDLKTMYPQAPSVAPGIKLFALIGADGAPIMLSDSRDAALANAWEHDLETVSLH